MDCIGYNDSVAYNDRRTIESLIEKIDSIICNEDLDNFVKIQAIENQEKQDYDMFFEPITANQFETRERRQRNLRQNDSRIAYIYGFDGNDLSDGIDVYYYWTDADIIFMGNVEALKIMLQYLTSDFATWSYLSDDAELKAFLLSRRNNQTIGSWKEETLERCSRDYLYARSN